MNLRQTQILILVTLLLVVAGGFPVSVQAHEGGPRLLLDTRKVVAGQPFEVRGANLGTDLAVRVELAVGSDVVVLGEAVCDGHGDFAQTFVLPTDLQTGRYTVQAIDSSQPDVEVVLASAQLSVSGPGLWGSTLTLLSAFTVLVLGLAFAAMLMLRKRQSNPDAIKQQDPAHSH